MTPQADQGRHERREVQPGHLEAAAIPQVARRVDHGQREVVPSLQVREKAFERHLGAPDYISFLESWTDEQHTGSVWVHAADAPQLACSVAVSASSRLVASPVRVGVDC